MACDIYCCAAAAAVVGVVCYTAGGGVALQKNMMLLYNEVQATLLRIIPGMLLCRTRFQKKYMPGVYIHIVLGTLTPLERCLFALLPVYECSRNAAQLPT